ncbi:hypothetical protein [Nitrospirillum pindoramense]|uniref:DUF945 domain-containing protein n=1 Tax=Nitrospirillum amazonense TaxID=28077 RepID=A0A560HCM8_9PROT|nr:hypothetical protein [Nitrospirillum amazonense]TWB44123.1 hypothetical protein FBZ90_10329 [Nitrospirillum amazonense]
MRMGKVLGAAAGVAVLAGIGYWGAGYYMGQKVIRELDAALAQVPEGVKVTRGSASFSLATQTLHVENLVIAGANLRGEAAALDIQGLSMRALASGLRADDTTATEQDVVPVASHITLRDIKVSGEGVEETIALSEMDQIGFRPWALHQPGTPTLDQVKAAFAAVSDRLATAPQAPLLPSEMSGPFQILAQAMAVGLLVVDYGDITQTGISARLKVPVVGPTGAGASPGQVVAGYDRVVLKGFHAGVYGPMEMTGLTETLPQGVVKVAQSTWAGGDLRAPAHALLRGEPLSEAMFNGVSVGSFSINGLSGQGPNGQPLQLGSMTLDPIVVADGHIPAGGLTLQGLVIDTAGLGDPQTGALAKAMGLTKLTMGMALHYKWDVKGSAVTLERTSVKVDELGELTLDAHFHGTASNQDLTTLLQSAQLDQARLSYVDHTLVDRLLRFNASQQGKTVDAARDQVVATLQANGQVLAASPRGEALLKAVVALVRQPGTLTLDAKPAAPVPLVPFFTSAMPAPAVVIDTLGLDATTAP